jgi:hypothetical protein
VEVIVLKRTSLAWLIIVVVSLLSGLFGYWRAEHLGTPAGTAAQGFSLLRLAPALGFAAGGVLFGWVARRVYLWMSRRWPTRGQAVFLGLAIGCAALLDLAAAIWRPGNAAECIVLNWLWALGYGWVMPRVVGGQAPTPQQGQVPGTKP